MSTVHTTSGCNALCLISQYFQSLKPRRTLGILTPAWVNYKPIFEDSVDLKQINMYNKKTNGFDLGAVLDEVKTMSKGSYVLAQVCGNNPTGVDMKEKEWEALSRLVKDKGLRFILDCAYAGLISGKVYKDVEPIRNIIEDKHNLFVCQSYSKNFSLYGERLGALHCIASNRDEAARLAQDISYSTPSLD